MTYDFHTRLDKLGPRMKTLNGISVSYAQPGTGTVNPITATREVTRREEIYPQTGRSVGMLRDYIFTAADLTISGSKFLPKTQDAVTETVGSDILTCTVMSDNDDPPYEYTTATRLRIRVHTKVTAVA